MPGTVVGLYCAVVARFELLVSTCMTRARETHAAFTSGPKACAHGWVQQTLVQGRPGAVNLKRAREADGWTAPTRI
jgi:hypothetical protein